MKTFANPEFLCLLPAIPSRNRCPDTNQPVDATVPIAIWSNTEAGLGITAASLATLRPLLRLWVGSHADSSYPSGFPRASVSRKRGNSARLIPLGSVDDNLQRDLRPDKLSVMVNSIESRRGVENTPSSSPKSSEERLNVDHATPSLQRKMEVGIHQTFEVTHTTSDRNYGEGSHQIVREHV